MISLIKMNNKHKKTLKELLTKPVLSNIKFDYDNFITLHKLHPNNEIKRYIVKKLQIFLKNIGVEK